MRNTIKIKTTSTLKKFEKISESQGNKLVGGFSTSIQGGMDTGLDGGTTNNCNGGNCVSGCGAGQNVQCTKI